VRNKYSGPALRINFWCVTREDLLKIADFFHRKFGSKTLEISLQTAARQSTVYTKFEEFEKDLEFLLSQNDDVQKLNFGRSEVKNDRRRHIWMEVEFAFSLASFQIYAEDIDGSLKEWVQSAYDEMQEMVSSFRPSPEFTEELLRRFHPRYPERRSAARSAVILDYDGNVTRRVNEELNEKKRSEDEPERLPEWLRDRTTAGVIAALFLLLVLNLFGIIFFR